MQDFHQSRRWRTQSGRFLSAWSYQGAGAFGTFTVTNDITRLPRHIFFRSRQHPVLARFSVSGEKVQPIAPTREGLR
jgi:hypothetical protein